MEYATKTGKAEGKKKIAKKLLKDGMSKEYVSKITELTLEEINNLLNS